MKKRASTTTTLTTLTAKEMARMDRMADAFLVEHDGAALDERVDLAKKHGTITTPEQLLKNDRRREKYGHGIRLAPSDLRGKQRTDDNLSQDAVVGIRESSMAECFQEKKAKKTKVWGSLALLEGSENSFGQDPADCVAEIEEYELAGGDAAVEAQAKAEQEEEERKKKDALSLIHPRDQERVKKFLAGVPVAQIAEEEGCTLQCVYEALARSEQRITVLLEYRRQCRIWALTGRGDRPDLPEIDDGATAEQLGLFALSDDTEVRK